jgi:hypothetical protein
MQFIAIMAGVVYLIVFGVDDIETTGTTVKNYPEQTIESLGWERSKSTGWVYHKTPGLTSSEQDELKRLLVIIESTDVMYIRGDISKHNALRAINKVRKEEVYKKYLTLENRH